MKSRPGRFLLAFSLLSAPLAAQTAYLVEDLVVGRVDAHSDPKSFLAVGNRVFFTALTGSGVEVHVTDGSPSGTRLLADICPGPCGSDPRLLGGARGLLFFLADPSERDTAFELWRSDGSRQGTFALIRGLSGYAFAGRSLFFNHCEASGFNCRLWKSDGTVEGTVQVKDFGDGRPGSLTTVGDRVFFTAEGPNRNPALWVSDGTEAGTSMVRELGREVSFLENLIAAQGRVFFTTRGQDGAELWASDGTAAGTGPVTAFETEDPFRNPRLKALGGEVFFTADDVTHGEELWRSDGTPQGTRRVTGIGYHQPFESSAPNPEVIGDRVLFLATDGIQPTRLWTVAGSPESAAPLDGCPGGCPEEAFGPLVRAGGRFVFQGRDADHGLEPWSTDGTAAGTVRLRDICSGTCSSFQSGPGPMALQGAVFFVASEDGAYDGKTSLWRTDGTPAGTKRFAGPDPAVGLETPAALGQRLVFSARNKDYGQEPWIGDGTPAGTRLIADLRPETPYGQPGDLAALDGRVFFQVQSGFCERLWRSAGVPGDLIPLTACGNDVHGMIASGGLLYFWYDEDYSPRVWATDGTPEGTRPTSPGLNTARGPYPLVPFQGRVYTLIDPGLNDAELWRMDGNGAVQITLTPEEGTPSNLGAVADRLYLETYVPDLGTLLWASDGADSRTLLIPGGSTWWSMPGARIGRWDYFTGHTNSGSGESQLWRTDGTAAGTTLVKGSFGSYDFHVPSRLTAHLGNLYFFAGTADAGWGLWKSDGTGAGTRLLRTFSDDAGAAGNPVSFGPWLFFAVDDGAHGGELWRTDGTPDGTVLVRDINPGEADARISDLTLAGGRLFFAAHDGVHGQELWQTDGIPSNTAGTRMVQDIAPLAESSYPAELTLAGDRLFFIADDGLAGRELWALPLASGAEGCHPTETALCLNQGRFKVEATWRDFQNRTGAGKAVSLTSDSGYFWFFGPTNVEVVVKVLDGQGVNGHRWVFYGALSNVEYTLTVTDTQTGLTRHYFNPMGKFASVGDTTGFGPLGAYSTVKPSPPERSVAPHSAISAVCQPSATRLCLQGGRFAVEVDWKDFAGKTGQGQAVTLTADTGYLWFFNASNVELVVKILDGRPVNGHFWVFYGALSSVEYRLKVTDLETGQVRTYRNPAGQLASAGYTSDF
jgi:ELWxxDGT repeat protein